ncbi:DUF3341 domain-containing protein [Roseivivax isoporae]|uniref:DUF3341 domain-containing protein n=1 Tax=Roseivivax isoporae LMG 25204 TaxID=1449351 RepID=X7F8L0_9RHOB|nr:DUF3341 domain-containing protein [Roseivivax isoporae]ETX29038.1 hypothetical protein RISW2_03595 [Roseivivax isoporae LMG 25204]
MTARLLLVFTDTASLVDAARTLRTEGVDGMDAHTPWRVADLEPVLEPPAHGVRRTMLIAGLAAAAGVFLLQTWSAVWFYPLNVGGRPLFSWPAFGFATFETGILGAAAGGFVAMIRACGLPRLHDPFFDTAETEGASDDRFFLSLPREGAPDRLRLSRLDGLARIVEVGR